MKSLGPQPSHSFVCERDGPHDDDRDRHVSHGGRSRRGDDGVGWGGACDHTLDRNGEHNLHAEVRRVGPHGRSDDSQGMDRSFCVDVGHLEGPWGIDESRLRGH